MAWLGLRNWLVAYDIRDPRRLKRVHAYLKRRAIPVQYSVFVLRGTEATLDRVLGGVESLIELAVDDVRAYYLPDSCEVTLLGLQALPVGITVGAPALHRLLQESGAESVKDEQTFG